MATRTQLDQHHVICTKGSTSLGYGALCPCTYCIQNLLHVSLGTLVDLTEMLELGHCGAQRALELCTSQSQLFQVVLYP